MGGILTHSYHFYHYQFCYHGYLLRLLLLLLAVLPRLLYRQLLLPPASWPLSCLSANRFRGRRLLAQYKDLEISPTDQKAERKRRRGWRSRNGKERRQALRWGRYGRGEGARCRLVRWVLGTDQHSTIAAPGRNLRTR